MSYFSFGSLDSRSGVIKLVKKFLRTFQKFTPHHLHQKKKKKGHLPLLQNVENTQKQQWFFFLKDYT